MRTRRILLLAALSSVSCDERAPVSRADSAPRAESPAAPTCDGPGVRQVVEQLGGRMQRVSLLAPDTVVARELREAYAPLVTPGLLAAWLADPAGAPGRKVSSPWPDRIEIRSVEEADDGVCRVEGDVVYATSADSVPGGEPLQESVRLSVRPDGAAWRISAYEVIATPSTGPTGAGATGAGASGAADVIRRYYAAIGARDFRRAYALWGNAGAASRQSFEEFVAGFARTTRVLVEVGEPGRVEPAAGSRYVGVPVVIRAVTDSGERQRFEGTYVLRRSVVDGVSPDERRWHIYSARIDRAG